MVARTHKDWFEFLQKAAELPIGYSVDDLLYFQRIAQRQYPALEPLVAACIHLAQTSDMEIAVEGPEPSKQPVNGEPPFRAPTGTSSLQTDGDHSRDMTMLLQDEKLFPKNTDLIRLATRLLPDMHQYRFDKMSRSSIISKIVDHMKTLPDKKRTKIGAVLRQAADATQNDPPVTSRSFFTRWEDIIKNMEL
jgi:hypothetical protein